MGTKMNLDIIKNINLGNYKEVQELAKIYVKHDDEFLAMAFDTGSLAVYVYSCFMTLEEQTATLHEKAAYIMNAALVYYNGYSCSIMHIRRMLRLEPDNLSYWSQLLYCNHIPDHLVHDEEAYQICLYILNCNPRDAFAKEMKDRIEKYHLNMVTESKPYNPCDEQYHEFVTLVHTGFYEQARALLSSYSYEKIAELLLTLTQRHQSVAFYTYAFFMLLDQEHAMGHLLAGQLLMQLKNVIGAQSGALFHARRAMQMDPGSLQCLDFFLSFYTLSESLLTIEEALYCARQIVYIDPEHEYARIVLVQLNA